jgi:hypothetical protein
MYMKYSIICSENLICLSSAILFVINVFTSYLQDTDLYESFFVFLNEGM